MEKYTIGEVKKDKINQFEVIIIADSNDADYITTREFYGEYVFDEYIIDELIDLIDNYSGSHELEKFCGDNVRIPYSDWGCCHSIESIEVNYYDNNGTVRPVEINSGFYTVCHKCDYDLEDCICRVKMND